MEFAEARVHKSGNSLHVSHGDDKGLYVEFFDEAVQHPFQSEQAGRPIFVEQPYVKILFPGDMTKQVVRPVDLQGSEGKPSDPERWPRQWDAYQKKASQVPIGTPLTQWAPMTKAIALTLKAQNIHTVEQLAELPDTALVWMGAREMHEKAKVWLASAKDGAEVLRLQQENLDLRNDVETLKKQFAELSKSRGKKAVTEE